MDQPSRRRPGSQRPITPRELARVERHLARTGNLTLAAEAIGRPVRSLHRIRRLDPAFAVRCTAAIARFDADRLRPARKAAAPTRVPRGAPGALLTKGGEYILLPAGPDGRPQLRRARAGQLTEDALDAFLRTVAATANVALAARSIGVSDYAIRLRRRNDLAFDQLVREAMEMGVTALRDQLLECAMRSLDERIGDSAEEWPTIGRMSAADVFAFLCNQEAHLTNPPRFEPGRRQAETDLAAQRLAKLLDRMRRERLVQGLPLHDIEGAPVLSIEDKEDNQAPRPITPPGPGPNLRSP